MLIQRGANNYLPIDSQTFQQTDTATRYPISIFGNHIFMVELHNTFSIFKKIRTKIVFSKAVGPAEI
jgi:hypothetical protein